MITKKDEGKLKELLEKQWCHKYFHNDRNLAVHDMYHEVDRANPHVKANASAALFKRLKIHLRSTDRIQRGQIMADVSTRNNDELREWCQHFGSIRLFHDFSRQYDLAIEKIQVSFDSIFHKVKIVLKTKTQDEGYYGGATNLRYENERIREERKIEMRKKAMMK